MTFAFKATSGRTHIGLAGVRNEDRFIIRGLGSWGAILAVADGLGGNVSGGYAADCIIDHLAALDQVETGLITSRGGDLLVLTTDGLHKPLTSRLLSTVLINREAIDQKAERLIEAALKTGGRDNMTIVLAKV